MRLMITSLCLDAFAEDDENKDKLNPAVQSLMDYGVELGKDWHDTLPRCRPEVKAYFAMLERMVKFSYVLAGRAKAKGYDPSTEIETPAVSHLATRVERLVGPPGIAKRIGELAIEVKDRNELAISIACEIAENNKDGKDTEAVLYQAIQTGLAIVTEGVLVAPLEGITGVKIRQNKDGSKYPALFFSGPIRSAGGTAQGIAVLLGDQVRKVLGLDRYKPTKQIIKRYQEELQAYRRIHSLQNMPSNEEIGKIVRGCPVCIDGEGTETEEVSGHRDIGGFTNAIRGGVALVITEGLSLKAKKMSKIVHALGIEGWEFIDNLEKDKGKGKDEENKGKELVLNDDLSAVEAEAEEEFERELDLTSDVKPNQKYMKEVIAGRPIVSLPSERGGFRLRYGRTRLTGIASIAIHPATCVLLEEFLAIGTQVKIERPGKAGIITTSSSIEPPIVLLKNGNLAEIHNTKQAKDELWRIERIVDLGEILIPFGEFLENNHKLVPGAYSVEWWAQELAKAMGTDLDDIDGDLWDPGTMTPERAIEYSKEYEVPLHPAFNLFWHDLTIEDILLLRDHVMENGRFDGEVLSMDNNERIKEILNILGALHTVEGERVVVDPRYSLVMVTLLGIEPKAKAKKDQMWSNNPLRLIWYLSNIKIRPRAPSRIGARMGRPEKAAERRMKPPIHTLFPIGRAGGNRRLLKDAAKHRVVEEEAGNGIRKKGWGRNGLVSETITNKVRVEVGKRFCPECRRYSPFITCAACGSRTKVVGKDDPTTMMEIEIGEVLKRARKWLGIGTIPDVKGVKGMMSRTKTPEPLEKGILRARHDVYVFKDGTCRYDMTDAPLTHFTPDEINTPVKILKALGYEQDINGKTLTSGDQMLELNPQDIIPSEMAGYYLLRVARFVDDELARFYGLEEFYEAKTPKDLIGHLIIGLAPHTSGGVVGRIIGYTKAKVCYSHPFFHTAKRRNCDGDEDCIMLLMDGLLNFSKTYLPTKRGGLMDAPLVITTRLDPGEVDKEVHNLDAMPLYPLEFYDATLKNREPKKVAKIMDNVGRRLGKPAQYSGLDYTHEADNINLGPRVSAYKNMEEMDEKIDGQFRIAHTVDAVDENVVAERVIETHFLPDIMGNLSKFCRQTVRCNRCESKYRRVPLGGKCLKCGNKLILTVHPKGVTKYLKRSLNLIENYDIRPYLVQRVKLLERYIKDTFREEKLSDETTIDSFFNQGGERVENLS